MIGKKSALCKDFGIVKSELDYERYWNVLIDRIYDSQWWMNPNQIIKNKKMITDIKQISIKKKLDRVKLQPYWSDYFYYEKDIVLYELTKNEFKVVIELVRKQAKPFIDSQQVISNILTKLGSKHNFHRQFRESHENSDSGQVLGMQLYHIMLEDSDVWIYSETKHRGHKFPHATYWIV